MGAVNVGDGAAAWPGLPRPSSRTGSSGCHAGLPWPSAHDSTVPWCSATSPGRAVPRCAANTGSLSLNDKCDALWIASNPSLKLEPARFNGRQDPLHYQNGAAQCSCFARPRYQCSQDDIVYIRFRVMRGRRAVSNEETTRAGIESECVSWFNVGRGSSLLPTSTPKTYTSSCMAQVVPVD